MNSFPDFPFALVIALMIAGAIGVIKQALGVYAIRTAKTVDERKLQAKLAERSITRGTLRHWPRKPR